MFLVFEHDGWGNRGRKSSIGNLAGYGKELLEPYISKMKEHYFAWRDVKNGLEKINKTSSPKTLISIAKEIETFKKEMKKRENQVE